MFIAVSFIFAISSDDCNQCYAPLGMQIKGIISGVVTILLAWFFASRYKKFESMAFDIANQPILETNEATAGVSFAGEGNIVVDSPLLSPYTQTTCVYYHAVLEQYVRRGKRSEWVIKEQYQEFAPCYLSDERGRLAIDLTGIDEDHSRWIVHKNRLANRQVYSEIDTQFVMHKEKYVPEGKGGKWRRSEVVFPVDTKAFVYGFVEKRANGLTLVEHDNDPLILSQKTQAEFLAEFTKGKSLIYMGTLFSFFGVLMILGSLVWAGYLRMEMGWLLSGIVAVALTLQAGVTVYNRIILLQNRAYNTLSNIEGELARRYDLIPNLNRIVTEYAQYEKEIHTIITHIRKAGVHDPLSAATNTNTHKLLQAIVEAYPVLQASKTVADLMMVLTDTEERIAYSRHFYNAAAQQYNTAIQQFPASIIAKITKLTPMSYITL